jgi:integrase
MATLYERKAKSGTRYYLNWSEDGAQFRRSLGAITRGQAKEILAEKTAELAGIIAPRSGVAVADVIADYLRWSEVARPDTWRGTRSSLRPFLADFGNYPADGLDPALVEHMTASRGVSSATQSKTLRLAKAAFRRAVRVGTIRESALERVQLPQVLTSRAPPWYTRQQLEKLYRARHGDLWRFMVNTGVRRAEAGKARRADVRGGLLYVESSAEGRTKSGKWRAVPLSRDAVAALKGLGADRLVQACDDTLSDWFTAEARSEGLQGTLHWLRHTFCTQMVQAGVSAHEIQRLAGHSSIAVTEKYMHHVPDAGRAAIRQLEGRISTRNSTRPAKSKRPRSSAG